MEQPVHHGRQSKVLIYNVDKDRNVGMIIRSAAAMGVSEVVVAGRKSKKLNTFGSQGTHKQLPMRHVPVFDDAVAELKRDGFHFIGVEIVDNAKPVDEVPFGENNAKIVFLFGNEGTGMSAPARRACDAFVRIRQFAPRTASLNVACAASIVLHAWACWAGLKEAPFAQEKFQVPDDLTLIVGTYTSKMGHVDGKGQGIYRVKVNPNTGLLTDAELVRVSIFKIFNLPLFEKFLHTNSSCLLARIHLMSSASLREIESFPLMRAAAMSVFGIILPRATKLP